VTHVSNQSIRCPVSIRDPNINAVRAARLLYCKVGAGRERGCRCLKAGLYRASPSQRAEEACLSVLAGGTADPGARAAITWVGLGLSIMVVLLPGSNPTVMFW